MRGKQYGIVCKIKDKNIDTPMKNLAEHLKASNGAVFRTAPISD